MLRLDRRLEARLRLEPRLKVRPGEAILAKGGLSLIPRLGKRGLRRQRGPQRGLLYSRGRLGGRRRLLLSREDAPERREEAAFFGLVGHRAHLGV